MRANSFIARGRIIFCICLHLVGIRCSFSPNDGGGTIETTNGLVTGSIVDDSGNLAPNTCVMLLPADYDPLRNAPVPDSCMDTTDGGGQFRIVGVKPGNYNIEAVQLTQRTRLLVTNIQVGTDTTFIPADTLKMPGAVKIILSTLDTLDKLGGYFHIAGTTIGCLLKGKDSSLTLDSVPAGNIPPIYYAVQGSSSAPKKIKDSVSVYSRVTSIITYKDWKYSRRLVLNTSASGAGVLGTVTNFPVLVRLNRNNFRFADAQNGGEDIRFTGSDGFPLPFEIDRWDLPAGEAEIWVKVDTVLGNNDSQYITLHWGNQSAVFSGSSKTVFDTAITGGGFQGVWHLGHGNTVEDATLNGYNGVSVNMTEASLVPGVIGKARQFSAERSYIEMPNTADSRLSFPENGVYTVSAWVYADTIDTLHRIIACKGRFQYFLKLMQIYWEMVVCKNKAGSQRTQASAESKKWCYIVGVRNGTSQHLFINGEHRDSSVSLYQHDYSIDYTTNFSIGSYLKRLSADDAQGYAEFKGKIDEVRVSSVPRSADWVKLCFMNQKADDVLVRFSDGGK